MSITLVDDLVEELEATVGTPREIAHEALVHLNHRGNLREGGREVTAGQLAKGDRYRVEYDYVHSNRLEVITNGEEPRKKLVRRHTVEQILGEGSPEPVFFSGDSTENERYFLLAPVDLGLPLEPGTRFHARIKSGPRQDDFIAVTLANGHVLKHTGSERGVYLRSDIESSWTVVEVIE